MTERKTFLALALTGEQLCRDGKFGPAVKAFLEALEVPTEDVSLLSAVYIQLGNAYFHLEQFDDALEYHTRDLHIARSLRDERGEAKASGNIAATLKNLNRFNEALICAHRQLELCKAFVDDPEGISRALYNTASIAHAKAKAYLSRHSGSSDMPESVRRDLHMAAEFYLQNYRIVLQLQDKAAQGRVCGNLGNVYYLLGDFTQALAHHQNRLVLACDSGDIPAQRRAETNIGNSLIFLGQYPEAAKSYKRALELVDVSSDRATEAQASYSLANCYSLMNLHRLALDLYQRHLDFSRDMDNLPAQATALLSLGCTSAALGNYTDARRYAVEHRDLCRKLGDTAGCATAESNIKEYTQLEAKTASALSSKDGAAPEAITLPGSASSVPSQATARLTSHTSALPVDHQRLLPLFLESPVRRSSSQSAGKSTAAGGIDSLLSAESAVSEAGQSDNIAVSLYSRSESRDNQPDEDFFDLLSRIQGKRLNDQRCEVIPDQSPVLNGSLKIGCHQAIGCSFSSREELMDFIAGIQSKRIDAQRAELPISSVNGAAGRSLSFPESTGATARPRAITVAGGEKQRSQVNPSAGVEIDENNPDLRHQSPEFVAAFMAAPHGNNTGNGAPRNADSHDHLPDSFYDMLMKIQGTRMEDQRCTVNLSTNRPAPIPAEDFSTIAQSRRLDNQRGADVPKSSSNKK